jgi:CDGSH-type Zn-finger protein
MSKPNIADTKPAVIELAAGTYYWCACGNSKEQPFCDGSHKGGEFHPEKIVLEKPTKMALCNCKQTNTPPCCDGSHRCLGAQ